MVPSAVQPPGNPGGRSSPPQALSSFPSFPHQLTQLPPSGSKQISLCRGAPGLSATEYCQSIICLCCYIKLPETGKFIKNKNMCSLKLRSPWSRCWQVGLSGEDCVLTWQKAEWQVSWLQHVTSFIKDLIPFMGKTQSLLKGPTFKCHHTGQWSFSTWILETTNSNHRIFILPFFA
jgi:hypothetical protein